MKNLFLSCLFAAGGLTASAQYFDYSTAAGWSANIQNTFSAPPGCPILPGPISGSINISGGVVNYRDVAGAHENRIWTSLSTGYSSGFNFDLDFNLAYTTSGKAIYAGVMTSQSLNPDYDVPMVTCNAAPVMDQLGIRLLTPNGYSDANPGVYIGLFDDGVNISPTNFVPISYGVTYYARVSVYGNGHAELFVYSDSNRTALVGSFCFDVPETIKDLKILQHSTLTGAGYVRTTRAWVDNTNIYETNFSCCRILIDGPSVISEGSGGFYQVTGISNPVVTIHPEDVIYSLTDAGGIIIDSWGSMPDQGPKVVTITVTGFCNCEEVTYTQTVYVTPKRKRSSETDPVVEAQEIFRVFPNPSSGMITVESDEEMKYVILSDISGKILKETAVSETKSMSFDMSSFPEGVYTVRVTTQNGAASTQVIRK